MKFLRGRFLHIDSRCFELIDAKLGEAPVMTKVIRLNSTEFSNISTY